MVVEILIAQGNGHDPLGDHGLLVMDDEDRVAGIGDDRRDGLEEAGLAAHFPEQEGSGIGGQPASQEVGDDRLGAEAGKGEGLAVTVCHGGGLAPAG